MKKITFLLLVTSFFSACESTNLLNGEKKYIINTDCGRVQLTSTMLRGVDVHVKVKSLDGNLTINADSAILKHPMPGAVLNTRIFFSKKIGRNKRVKGPLLLKKGKVLLYSTHIFLPIDYDQHYFTEYNKTYIIPNTFILCRDKPVVTDTIKINNPGMARLYSDP